MLDLRIRALLMKNAPSGEEEWRKPQLGHGAGMTQSPLIRQVSRAGRRHVDMGNAKCDADEARFWGIVIAAAGWQPLTIRPLMQQENLP